MLKALTILCIFVAIAAGQQAGVGHKKHVAANDRPPAPTVTYESNCCNAQAPQKPTDKPHKWYEDYNSWLVIVATVTCFVVAWQSLETHRATDIARRTLLSTLRPRLIVRQISIHFGTRIPTWNTPDDDPWTVDFEFANVGTGRAMILSYAFAISRIRRSLPNETTYMGNDSSSPLLALEPGEERQLSIPVDDDLKNMLRLIGQEGLSKGYQNTDNIYFFGQAEYSDALGIRRNIAVCRRYDNASTRFLPVDDPDREYSD